MFKRGFSCWELRFVPTFCACSLWSGWISHSIACLWVLLLHHETAIKRSSPVDTFLFMFSSMSRCWYKLPPRVTLQILNTCLALINSSEVFQAPWKCYLRFHPPPLPPVSQSEQHRNWSLVLFKRCFSLFTAREMTRGKFLNILERSKKWLFLKEPQESPDYSHNL